MRPEVSVDLAAIVRKALTKRPNERYQRVEELLAALDSCQTTLSAKEASSDENPSSRFPTRPLKKAWLRVGGLAFVAVALVFYLARPLLQGPGKLTPTNTKLAILPFENLGSAEEQYFIDGITDEIVDRLGNIRNLDVMEGSRVPDQGVNQSLHEMGSEFGADYVLTGALHLRTFPDGSDSVHLSSQILRIPDSTLVWAHVYQSGLGDIFQVQSNIAEQVSKVLDLQMPQKTLLETRPTTSLQAYDYYLRGLIHARQSSKEHELKKAFETLGEATKLDPTFALAHAWLSITHSMMYWFHFDRSEARIAMAKASADRALKLAPDLSEAYQALGHYYYRCHLDYEQAMNQFEAALTIKPNDDHVLVGIASVKRRQGKFREAVAYFERAVEFNPRGPGLPLNTADTYRVLREYAHAESYYDLAMSFEPSYERIYARKSLLYLGWLGRTTQARSVLAAAPQDSNITYRPFIAMAWFLADLIDRNYEQALRRLLSEPQKVLETQFYYIPMPQLYAQVYGLLGHPELERAYYDATRVHLQAKLLEQPNNARLHSSLGIAYAGLGQMNEAIREGQKGAELMPVSKEAWKGLHRIQDLARIYVMLNRYDAALDQIEYLLSVPGELTTTLLRTDPTWAPLKDHPRFQKLLRYDDQISAISR
jgi:serine/threonine-protein kinase